MTSAPKALEDALKAAAKVYASQDKREPPTLSDIEGTAEDLRSPINAFLAIADLVPHSDVQAALDYLTAQKNLTAEMMRERDEALLELDVTKKLYRQALDDLEAAVIVYKAERKVTDKRGRQLAALREAIMSLRGHAFATEADQQLVEPLFLALTDTAAAARYRLVDEWQDIKTEPEEDDA